MIYNHKFLSFIPPYQHGLGKSGIDGGTGGGISIFNGISIIGNRILFVCFVGREIPSRTPTPGIFADSRI
jgi:hypothetical protein